jgi:hypothetical protein
MLHGKSRGNESHAKNDETRGEGRNLGGEVRDREGLLHAIGGWTPLVTANVINKLLEVNHVPPETAAFVTNGRSCSRSWFFKAMPNADKKTRRWLSYSTSTDSFYSVDSLLFAGPTGPDT